MVNSRTLAEVLGCLAEIFFIERPMYQVLDYFLDECCIAKLIVEPNKF